MTKKNNIEQTNFGYVVTWIETEDYTSKILVFEKEGGKTPIHFHKKITKSWFINSGNFKITWIDTKDGQLYEKEYGEGTVFHVPPCTPCGLTALTAGSSVSQTSNSNDEEDYLVLSN